MLLMEEAGAATQPTADIQAGSLPIPVTDQESPAVPGDAAGEALSLFEMMEMPIPEVNDVPAEAAQMMDPMPTEAAPSATPSPTAAPEAPEEAMLTATLAPEATVGATVDPGTTAENSGGFNSLLLIPIILIAVLAAAGVVLFMMKKSSAAQKREVSDLLRRGDERDGTTRPADMEPAEFGEDGVKTTPMDDVPETRPSGRVARRGADRKAPAKGKGSAGKHQKPEPLSVTEDVGEEERRLTPPYRVGYAQTMGARPNQEDTGWFSNPDPMIVRMRGLLAVVCDGIGGLSDGQVASATAVRNMKECFERQNPARPLSDRLLELAALAQQSVLQVNRGQAHAARCGSTLVTVLIQDRKLAMLSVGDSRIALYRAGVLLQLNREHVLGKENDENIALSVGGEKLDPRKQSAITAYLGKENLRLIDRTLNPMQLVGGDRILLMSDGVYNALSDDEIISALKQAPDAAARTIIEMVNAKRLPHQDNATIVIVGVDD